MISKKAALTVTDVVERQLLKERQHGVVSRSSCKNSKASISNDSSAPSRVAGPETDNSSEREN